MIDTVMDGDKAVDSVDTERDVDKVVDLWNRK